LLLGRHKILFLDVLFPLNVSRIIYVDADQVRRLSVNNFVSSPRCSLSVSVCLLSNRSLLLQSCLLHHNRALLTARAHDGVPTFDYLLFLSQVVRGDISELRDLDLQGAPYAYTPFCDSNPDTEGFK
jgi:hypothetical protein